MTFTRGTINIGTREAIRLEAAASGIFDNRRVEDLEDIDLLKFTAFAGRQEWFEWLLGNCSFYNSRGNIKKDLKQRVDESLILAVRNNHIGIARKLFELGAKSNYMMGSLLYQSIMKGRHEMAELLFANGARIKQHYHLAECMSVADDRMKKIIQKGIMDTIGSKFRS